MTDRMKFSYFLLIIGISASANAMFPLNKRLYRSLPSVSDDHYQEQYADGTYKYAYTGENRYTAERRLSDGTVEGETLYVRPDGIPVKVHFFADANGYRPKTDVLYSERLVARTRTIDIPVPDGPPPLYLAPPPEQPVPVPVAVPVAVPYHVPKPIDDASVNVRLEGSNINIGGGRNGGEDVAVANPSITAIVGPGGHAEIRPESIATTRSGGRAISNPTTNAVIGPGGSVVLAPSAKASTVSDDDTIITTTSVRSSPGRRILLPDVHTVVPLPHPPVSPVRTVVPVPVIPEVRAGVVVVPPQSSYSYEYSYSAPDSRHPAAGDNRAHVAVRVNSK